MNYFNKKGQIKMFIDNSLSSLGLNYCYGKKYLKSQEVL